MLILPLYVFLPIYFYFGKFPNLLGIPSMNFCFLEVNLCEMSFFNTVNPFIVLKNGSKILTSEPTVTLADHTFNYTVFFLLTTGRLTALWIVLETRVLRDGFRCPLLGAIAELSSFCLLSRAQGQAWSGAGTSLLRADSCRPRLG